MCLESTFNSIKSFSHLLFDDSIQEERAEISHLYRIVVAAATELVLALFIWWN